MAIYDANIGIEPIVGETSLSFDVLEFACIPYERVKNVGVKMQV